MRVLQGGTVFDGDGGPGRAEDVWIADGRIDRLVPHGTPPPAEAEVVDCAGRWVCPGFIDLHTHYDAEVELAPALGESVRHGVTTVVLGSCGLSMACGRPVDLADMFCRVEGIPRSTVLPLLERIVTWRDPAGYLAHLEAAPLGPNVACLLGHSTIRAHAMGMERSVTDGVRPTPDELGAMVGLLESALDAGYLGLSVNTLPWDKLDGEAFRSRPTPSVFATWGEYRALARVLRQRDRILQGVPDLSNKLNATLFYLEALAIGRKALRTMIITMADTPFERIVFHLVGGAARLVNALGGRLRVQSLPHVFDMWVDGLDVPVLEELGAGTEAKHLTDPDALTALLRDPAFRARFAKEWHDPWAGRAYHRDLDEPRIIACPDAALVGRSFADVARDRGCTPVEALLDLVAAHGAALRWYTVLANDRDRWLDWICRHPAVLIGFSDAGAHLRNVAFYNFGVRLLRRAAERSVMPIGRAVHRLTGEIADYLEIDAGHLRPGAPADVTVVDPAGLTDAVDGIAEAPMPGFADLNRLVRRNDAAVPLVLVRGRVAWRDGAFAASFGAEPGFGRVLRTAS